jgi:hypothetical protein
MRIEKTYLVIGIAVGLLLAFFYFHYFAPRYELQKTDLSVVKIDKWTGKSWQFTDNNWTSIADMDENSKEVDKALHEALQIPYSNGTSTQALNLLRGKYPLLKKINDDELLERIKVVYSKQILCGLYLDNFLKMHKAEVKVKPQAVNDKKGGV